MTEPDNTIARYKFSHEPKWSKDSNTNFIVPKHGVSVYITLKYILVSSKYLVRFKRIWNSVLELEASTVMFILIEWIFILFLFLRFVILSQLSSPTCYVCNFFQLTIVRSNTLQHYIYLVKGKCSKNVISLRHTVHWRVQICHKNMSVVYDIKKWFLLIYLLTAGRPESEPCYL